MRKLASAIICYPRLRARSRRDHRSPGMPSMLSWALLENMFCDAFSLTRSYLANLPP
jgi:hypothetical protein